MDHQLLNEVTQYYRKLVDEAKEPGAKEQYEDLKKKMLEADFVMSGKPFPTFMKPLLIDRREVATFEKATRLVMSASEKVADLYFTNPEYKPLFEVDEQDQPLVEIQPNYPRRVINARLDAFLYDDGTVKFLEFNCDSPSGMGWHDSLVGFFDELPVVQALKEKYDVKMQSLLEPFHAMLMKKYEQSTMADKPEKPTVAVICSRESTILSDVEIMCETFNRLYDHETIIADPRDGSWKNGQFCMKGKPVHLVFRDSIEDFTKCMDEVQPILDAYRQHKIVMVNPFCSRVGGLKAVLYLLTDDRMQKMFTDEEKQAIIDHVPWTRIMNEGKTLFKGEQVDLYPFVRENKDMFVLKPNSGHGGFGVTIGSEVDETMWDKVLEDCKKSNWVCQEFIEIPRSDFPQFDPELTWKTKNVNINFWSYDGQYGGAFVRVADSSVINVHQGGGLMPVCYIDGRK